MNKKHLTQKGFALVAALLLLLLLTALTVGVSYMTRSELSMSNSDSEATRAEYAAQAGTEQMMTDLFNVYANQAPTTSELNAVASTAPTITGSTISLYKLQFPTDVSGNPLYTNRTLKYGSNAGLFADVLPLTIDVVATRNSSNAQAHDTRLAEVALIPLFQFGVFSQTDLSYFPGADYDFGGRVHTNGNLYLASESGTTLTFHDQVSAYGQVIRSCMANGQSLGFFSGAVKIPTRSGGCDGSASYCRALAASSPNEGSIQGCPGSGATGNWNTISRGSSPADYNGMLINGNFGAPGGTGAQNLTLAFTQSGTSSIEIIRRPANLNESLNTPSVASSGLEAERLYNLSNIQVLLADTPLELPSTFGTPSSDPDIVDLGNLATSYTATGDSNGATFFAKDSSGNSLLAGAATNPDTLGHAYLEVRIRISDGSNNGVWTEVTRNWLQLGFARDRIPPDSEASTLGVVTGGSSGSTKPTMAISATNTVHPNAILLLQELKDTRATVASGGPYYTHTVVSSTGRAGTNFIPINLYDTREGSENDTNNGACYLNGIMSTVEIDMKNLKSWLASQSIGTIMTAQEDGYLLYFSDRRGMLTGLGSSYDATKPKLGEFGWEDVYPPAGLAAPKDVNGNSQLDTYGQYNLGQQFNYNTGSPASPGNPTIPYTAVTCDTARTNWVSGARHALTLVNGSLGNLPNVANGGFTVASENPVYVLGDYNANQNSGAATPAFSADSTHVPTAIIADAVTLLSWNWSNENSFDWPTDSSKRQSSPTGNKATFYRMAVESGKGPNFPYSATGYPYGTDGGANNFLRYLESWGTGNYTPTISHYYMGSLVSLYYSRQGTGTFKCCNLTVYGWPIRKFQFDPDFTNPQTMPPGTPRLRDIDNTGATVDLRPQDQNGQQ